MTSKQLVSSILLAATAVSAFPADAMATTTYDLRKKVIQLTGIMNPGDGSRYISRAEFASMLVKASEYRSTVSSTVPVSVFADEVQLSAGGYVPPSVCRTTREEYPAVQKKAPPRPS